MRFSVDLQKQEGWDMECAVHGNDAAFTDRCFHIWTVSDSLGTGASNVLLGLGLFQCMQAAHRCVKGLGAVQERVLTGHTGSCRGSRWSCQLRCSLLSGGNLVLQVEHLRGD